MAQRHCAMAAVVAALLFVVAAPLAARADDIILSGMTAMRLYPSTWNASAPKVVSDGLHAYTVLCGYDNNERTCGLARRRANGSWSHGSLRFTAFQPPTMILDRKGRLNIFFNDPYLHHFRLDHPSVDLENWSSIPFPYSLPTGYIHATYDSQIDLIQVTFNDTATWQPYFTVKYTDFNVWMTPSPLPQPDANSMYLYLRSIRAGGRYYILAGEHTRNSANSVYTGVVLWSSPNVDGPWTTRVIHRVTGDNLGVFYRNMALPLDLQADSAGRLRIMMHIDESGSGHPGLTEGMYLARIEDGFAPRLIGRHIDDGFTLDIDPSGVQTAFALIQSNVDDPERGHLVAFRSVDGGVTWSAGQRVVDGQAVNPVLIQARNGSMLGGKSLEFIYTPTLLPPFDSVLSASIDLGLTDTDDRYDDTHAGSDGVIDYVRHYRDVRGDRAYTYTVDNAADGSYRLTYSYASGDYTQTYTASSDGNVRYENSDGYQYENVPTKLVQYWYDDGEDGARNYIYIFRDPAEEILWWAIYDFNTAGSYDFTYVYYRGAYYYVEFRYADGRVLRYDSTGFYEAQ